eukprot:jgi/Botrbrau1/6049/Bobra.0042s0032.1
MTVAVVARMGMPHNQWHWAVRKQAASLLGLLISKHGAKHRNVLPRVSKSLLNGLQDESKPLTSHYGCIRGIQALGPRAVRLNLLPILLPYMRHLNKRKGPEGPLPDGQIRQGKAVLHAWQQDQDAVAVQGALREAVAECVYQLLIPTYGRPVVPGVPGGLGPKGSHLNKAVPVQRAWHGDRWPAVSASQSGQPSQDTGLAVRAPTTNGAAASDFASKFPKTATKPLTVTNGDAGSNPSGAPLLNGPSTVFPPSRGMEDGNGHMENGFASEGAEATPSNAMIISEKEAAIIPVPENGRLLGKPSKSLSLNKQLGKQLSRAASTAKSRSGDQRTSEENPLEHSWKEDFDVGKIVALVTEVFGDSVAPYLPTEYVSTML